MKYPCDCCNNRNLWYCRLTNNSEKKSDIAVVVEVSRISTWTSHFFAVPISQVFRNCYASPYLALQIFTSSILNSDNFCPFSDSRQQLWQTSFHLHNLYFLVKSKALSIDNLKVIDFILIFFREENGMEHGNLHLGGHWPHHKNSCCRSTMYLLVPGLLLHSRSVIYSGRRFSS